MTAGADRAKVLLRGDDRISSGADWTNFEKFTSFQVVGSLNVDITQTFPDAQTLQTSSLTTKVEHLTEAKLLPEEILCSLQETQNRLWLSDLIQYNNCCSKNTTSIKVPFRHY